jgi:hypothetical protein
MPQSPGLEAGHGGELVRAAQFVCVTYRARFLYESQGMSPVFAATLLMQAQLATACSRGPIG